MKTHQLAEALDMLARTLRTQPNVELSEWSVLGATKGGVTNGLDPADVGLRLSTLAGLSRISKSQWKDLIDIWDFPIDIKPTNSARDVVGYLMSYLSEHPEAVRKIQKEAAKKNKKVSPKLMEALSVLLGEQ